LPFGFPVCSARTLLTSTLKLWGLFKVALTQGSLMTT
jgi:hypothetical protein